MLSYAALLFKTKKEEKTDGQVWIKNKKIFIKDEKGLGSKPAICPREGIKLLINDIEYKNSVTVSEKDKIEIKPELVSTEESITVTISENQAEAWLHTIPAQVIRYEILDSDPANILKLKAFEIIQNVRFIPEDKVYGMLKHNRIDTGIVHENIEKACNTFEEKNTLVAIGIPAVPSKDSWIEYFFSNDEFEIKLNENKKGKIDFKNSVDYKSSKVGDILAVKHSAEYGKTGISVTGEIIQPGIPKDFILAAGNGVVIEGDGRIARCVKAGKAQKSVEGNTVTISINENLKVDRNIDIKTGNVKFSGNVEINGTVKEAMEIDAEGSIRINGDSLFSVVKSADCIDISGNVISSRIETVETAKTDNSPLKYFKSAAEILDNIIDEIKASIQNKSFEEAYPTGISSKVKKIIKANNPKIYRTLKNLITVLKNRKYECLIEKAEEIITSLKIISNNCEEVKSIDHLYQIKAIISAPVYILEQSIESEGNIALDYVVNSSVSAKGSVKIGSKGCINCTINATDTVAVKGIVRGGKIHSGTSVELDTVGSDAGVTTIISVPENGTIKIRKVFSENIIKVGNLSYRFIQSEENVYARIIDNNLVVK